MFLKTSEQIERLARYTRGHLWFALGMLLLLAGAAAMDVLVPGLDIPETPLWISIPVYAVIGYAFNRTVNGVDFSSTSPAWQAVRDDELRRHARAKAFRNGFLAMLAYPPLCAMAVLRLGMADPLGAVVVSGAWLGLLVFVASLLWYDR